TPSRRRTTALLASGLVLLTVVAGYFFSRDATLSVAQRELTITTVSAGVFNEYINLSGRVEPAERYFIDSRVTGTVDRIFAESGQEVKQGDTLLLLANADLELEVMQRESQLIEQLNAQRQTRLLLDQNDFTRREQLLEADYQLALGRKQFRRSEQLLTDSLIAPSEYEPTENRYAYYQGRQRLLRASLRQDSVARRTQLRQIAAFEARLLANLEQVRSILDRLYVLAPTDGQLSDFTVQTGEAIATGQRLGEIYQMQQLRIAAEADEFYLNKITQGQQGFLLSGRDSLALRVEKIYPTVTNGRFRLDVGAVTEPSQRFTKGQTLRVRLLFGPPEPSTLLASGGFYGSTGGYWVYRLARNDLAVRTPVRLGRSNPDYYEVLEGLRPGDRVITSNYDAYAAYASIKLD
ncbi:MAG: efflux RND transporter periplasmic adaptor subunit, partial [Bacteroidota bacterium]